MQPLRVGQLKQPLPVCVLGDLYGARDGLEELYELGEAIVRHPALAAKVVVVAGDELVEGQAAVRGVAEELDAFRGKL